MTSKIEDEGRRMLRSVDISTKKETFERIVKVSDPSSKFVELAEKLGSSDQDLGHVTRKVLKMTSRPVVLLK
jgi:hypothetical protein